MQFVSTRNTEKETSFQEAVFQGLAPDGGLYRPTTTPDLTSLFHNLERDTPFSEMAKKVVHALFSQELNTDACARIAEKAFPFEPKLHSLTKNLSVLELFHGPSCAFKDFGASFLATVMEEFLQGRSKRAIILTATSGDTGSAVARAFYGKKYIDVVILYPSGRVSPLQEKQLTTLGGNIQALEVKGAFDDCQRMVKEAFVDPELSEKLPLTSANSINLGRLIPQSFYYMFAWMQTKNRNPNPVFCVPSGNFGNLTAGVYAWSWGLPIKHFIAATNINDIVPAYLLSSIYNPKASKHTLSNAMDVGDPSNFERLTSIFDNDWQKMKKMISGEVVTDAQTLEKISAIHKDYGYIADPHTAVGITAAQRYLEKNTKDAVITLSTAHPGKFTEVVQEALKITPDLPNQLAEVLTKEKQSTEIRNSLEELRSFLLSTYK